MIKAIRNDFIPNKVIILNPTEQKTPEIFQFVEFIKSQSSIGGKATAYICSNYLCKNPTARIEKMLELLELKT